MTLAGDPRCVILVSVSAGICLPLLGCSQTNSTSFKSLASLPNMFPSEPFFQVISLQSMSSAGPCRKEGEPAGTCGGQEDRRAVLHSKG